MSDVTRTVHYHASFQDKDLEVELIKEGTDKFTLRIRDSEGTKDIALTRKDVDTLSHLFDLASWAK